MRIAFTQTFQEDEARRELSEVRARIASRRRLLEARWRAAGPTDRLLAAHRLLLDRTLDDERREILVAHHEAVTDAWKRARQMHARVTRAEGHVPAPRDLPLWRHAATIADMELMRVEAARDHAVAKLDLWDALFACGETYLLASPYTREVVPLRELTTVCVELEERVRAFKSRKVKFTLPEMVS